MLRKIILLFSLIFSIVSTYAQVQSQRFITGKVICTQTGSGVNTFRVSCNFTDEGGLYDGTNIQLGDLLYFTDGGYGFYLPIINIVSAGPSTVVVDVSNTGTGLGAVPSTTGYITRGSENYLFLPFVSGITNADQQVSSEHNLYLIDSLLYYKLPERTSGNTPPAYTPADNQSWIVQSNGTGKVYRWNPDELDWVELGGLDTLNGIYSGSDTVPKNTIAYLDSNFTIYSDATNAELLIQIGNFINGKLVVNSNKSVISHNEVLTGENKVEVNNAGITFRTNTNGTDYIKFEGPILLNKIITPSTISSNQNNYSLTGLNSANFVRLSSSTNVNITGIATSNNIQGRVIGLHNIGAFTITLKNNNGGSLSQNRFLLTDDYFLAPNDVVLAQYDSTSLGWRLYGIPRQFVDSLSMNGGTLRMSLYNDKVPHKELNITENIQDIVGAMIGTQTNISVTYNDATGLISYVASGGGGGGSGSVLVDTFQIFGDDIYLSFLLDSVPASTLDISKYRQHLDTFAVISDTLYASISDDSIPASFVSLTKYLQRVDTFLIEGSILTISLLNDGVPTSTVNLQEPVQDLIGGMVSSNTEVGINVTYNDLLGKLNFTVHDSSAINELQQIDTFSLAGSVLSISLSKDSVPAKTIDLSGLNQNIGNSDLTTDDNLRTLTLQDDFQIVGDGASPEVYIETGSLGGGRVIVNTNKSSIYHGGLGGTNEVFTNANGIQLFTPLAASRSITMRADSIIEQGTVNGELYKFYPDPTYIYPSDYLYINGESSTGDLEITWGDETGTGKGNITATSTGDVTIGTNSTAEGTVSVNTSTNGAPALTLLVTPVGEGFNALALQQDNIYLDTETGDPFKVNAPIEFSNIITPPDITVSQNDYNPTDLDDAHALLLTSTANVNITGLVSTGFSLGRQILISNRGTFNITLVNESASSSAANRFSFPGNYTISPKCAVILEYLTGTNRWIIVSGGSPLNVIGSANQVFGINNAGTGYEWKTIQGTVNQVNVTNGVGTYTLSTPQDIHTAATPTFSDLTLTDDLFVTDDATIGTGNSISVINMVATTANTMSLSAIGGLTIGSTSGNLTMNSGAVGGYTIWDVGTSGNLLQMASGNTSGTSTTTNGVRTDYIMNDGSALESGHLISVNRYQSRGVAATIRSGAQMVTRADATWSNTSAPAEFVFSTTPIGGTVLQDRLIINSGGEIDILSNNSLRLFDTDNSNHYRIKSPVNDSLTTNATWILPRIKGTDGQVLKIRGDSLLYWADDLSGGGSGGNGIYGGDGNIPNGGSQVLMDTIGETVRFVMNTGNTTLREMVRLETVQNAFTRFFVLKGPTDSLRVFRTSSGREFTFQTYGGTTLTMATDSIIKFVGDSMLITEDILPLSGNKIKFLVGLTGQYYGKRVEAVDPDDILISNGTDWVRGKMAANESNVPHTIRITLSAKQNNYNPSGLSLTKSQTIRVKADASFRFITGLEAATRDGVQKTFINDSTNCFGLAKLHTDSDADNRFNVTRDVIIYPGMSVTIQYDSVSQKWNLISTNQNETTFASYYDVKTQNTGVIISDNFHFDGSTRDGGSISRSSAGNITDSKTGTTNFNTGTSTNAGVACLISYNGIARFNSNEYYLRTYTRVRFEDLSSATEDYDFTFGYGEFSGIDTTADAKKGVYVTYKREENSGGFVLKSHDGTTQTSVNAGSAIVADTWYEIEVIYYPFGEAACFINGVRYSKTNNIPTSGSTSHILMVEKDAGTTSRTAYINTLEERTVVVNE